MGVLESVRKHPVPEILAGVRDLRDYNKVSNAVRIKVKDKKAHRDYYPGSV